MNATVVTCWVVFFIYWMVSATRVKATVERQSAGSQVLYRVLLMAAYVLLVARLREWGLDAPAWPYHAAIAVAGTGLVILGLAGAIWARRTLGGNWSSTVTLKEGHTLIQSGPYAWTRNPIYTAMLTMVVGTGIEVGRVRGLVAIALTVWSFWIKLKQEEQFMLRRFPVEYPPYQRRVKALVPFLF